VRQRGQQLRGDPAPDTPANHGHMKDQQMYGTAGFTCLASVLYVHATKTHCSAPIVVILLAVLACAAVRERWKS